ncbi:MAG: calcium-binding protein [Cyanobacteria bacterium J06621_11]
MQNLPAIKVDTLIDENNGNLDKGNVSLREALAAVKQGGRITFDQSLANEDTGFGKGVIGLSLGELIIDKSLTIQGLGTEKLTVSGNRQSRVFSINDGNDNKNSDVIIRDLTITEGEATDGGGILSGENTSVLNSHITNNSQGIFGSTGVITEEAVSNAKLTVRNSIISGNQTGNNNPAVDRSRYTSPGSGIVWGYGSITIANTNITNNQSYGIRTTTENSKLRVAGSNLENNQTGIQAQSNIELVNSTLANNNGDGIYTNYSGENPAKVTITGSSITDDSVTVGGYIGSEVKLIRSTISGNDTRIVAESGARATAGNLTIVESTLNGTSAIAQYGTARIRDSLISGSTGNVPFRRKTALTGFEVDMQRSTILNSEGYGVTAYRSARINNSTISGGQAGGLRLSTNFYTDSLTLAVNNSTLSGNGQPSSESGGIFVDPYSIYLSSDLPYTVRLNHTTITGNTGRAAGGVLIRPSDENNYYGGPSSITVSKITIAGNSGFDLVSDPVKSLGNNIIGNGDRTAGFTRSSDVVGSSKRAIDPLANVIRGRNGKDRLVGTKNSDIILGRDGSDTLIGNSGNDLLLGERGRDKILGGAGDDIINGGKGSDQLRGGSGQDTFVYQRLQHGKDIISDFQASQDKIDLSAILSDPRYSSNILFEAYIRIGQHGRNSATVSVLDIDRSGTEKTVFRDLAILRNVSIAAIDEGSFVL